MYNPGFTPKEDSLGGLYPVLCRKGGLSEGVYSLFYAEKEASLRGIYLPTCPPGYLGCVYLPIYASWVPWVGVPSPVHALSPIMPAWYTLRCCSGMAGLTGRLKGLGLPLRKIQKRLKGRFYAQSGPPMGLYPRVLALGLFLTVLDPQGPGPPLPAAEGYSRV